MINKDIHKLLLKLHSELQNTPPINDQDHELLQTLMDDIQKMLKETPEESITQKKMITDKLNKAIFNMEKSHPTLVLIIQQVTDTLSNMGI